MQNTVLIVRLPNYIGDVILALPSLEHLLRLGFELQCIGKGWAKSLLAAHDLNLHTRGKSLRENAAQIRRLKALAAAQGKRVAGLVLVRSFSGALEMRLGGVGAVGYACDGRSWLLRKAVKENRSLHYRDYYASLAANLPSVASFTPSVPKLNISSPAAAKAQARLGQSDLTNKPYIVMCPFASNDTKRWPHFLALAQQLSSHYALVICPGGNEDATAYAANPNTFIFDNVGIDEYLSLLQSAKLVISNDSGPGHMTAAVGGRLLSIFGQEHSPAAFAPLGENVTVLQAAEGWLSLADVQLAAETLLRT